ncbi:DUF1648 domain-containing protein [Kineococcus sp. SYSU DK006]|uniref:DUF1648 domain-containing protein n=1 Tax=Kineococcus sp. SYSU DK006 TaxID=3383127 RepID=UPI003D7D0CF4
MSRNAAPVAFALTTVAAVAAVIVAALVLPERVPTHFGATGDADDWSSRAGAVTFLALLTAGMAGMFAAFARGSARMSMEWVNVPHKQRWIEAGLEAELRRRLREDLLLFGAGTNVLVLSTTLAVIQAARSGADALPWWWVTVFALWLVATIAHAVFMQRVRYRLERVVR